MPEKRSRVYDKQHMSVIDINVLHDYYDRRFNRRSQNPLHTNRAYAHAYTYDNEMTWDAYLANVVKSGVRVIGSLK